jgi:cytochrome c553
MPARSLQDDEKEETMQPKMILLTILLLPTTAFAGTETQLQRGEKIANAGKGTAPPCMACHGARGEGMAAGGFPRLAGLNKEYLLRQMRLMKDGKRQAPVMAPVVAALSDDDVAAVVAWYAALPAPAPKVQPQSGDKTGRRIAERGLWNKGVPACNKCHGPGGAGVGDQFPALAGQNKSYLASQLKGFRDGTRTGDPVGLMSSVAKKLTDAEIEAVAAFYDGGASQ